MDYQVEVLIGRYPIDELAASCQEARVESVGKDLEYGDVVLDVGEICLDAETSSELYPLALGGTVAVDTGG